MKYRVFALMSLLALGVGSLMAQDYDDIYYDASKAAPSKSTKVVTPAKTAAVYGEVPEKYKQAAQVNYSIDRDVDEYNRRGVYEPSYEPSYEVTITGDTIFYGDSIYNSDEAFANTRRIERFYNPDIVVLSDDDELVELYYDESPTVNLIIGSDWGYSPYYSWGYSSYYPWYTGWYDPWYPSFYRPWYYSYWHRPWYYNTWYWGYRPWYYDSWHWGWYGHSWSWNNWAWHNSYAPYRHNPTRYVDTSVRPYGHRAGLASNRNSRGRVDATSSNRNAISSRGAGGSRNAAVGNMGSRSGSRGGYATSRGGNMSSRNSSGVTQRSSSASGGYSSTPSRSSSRSSSYGSSRSSSSSSGSTYRGSSSSGSSRGGGSYSGGGSYGGGGGSHSGGSGSGGSGSRRH